MTSALPDSGELSCEVLVVGAGPAGSACAHRLASRGVDVLLADQHEFPRDKTCGDGLIPDAHSALARLGVLDEVMALARPISHVRCVGPRGGSVDVPGRLAVLPRRELDDLLCRHAARAGARLMMPWRFDAPWREPQGAGAGRVIGACLQGRGSPASSLRVRARWVVLATGAVPQALIAAGLCERRAPSSIALRGYVRHAAMAARHTTMDMVWHPRLRYGYGWIFPCRDGVFNIGVGQLAPSPASRRRWRGGAAGDDSRDNLRAMFKAFCEVYAPAAELIAGGQAQGELMAQPGPAVGPRLQGAPLRCTLQGARWSEPGLLVTGEAAGTTYAFTGEGIGKAMETGLLAADAICAAADDAAVRDRYEAALRALQPRFAMYERANAINTHPWLADLVLWRARRQPALLRHLSGVLDESRNPGNLISLRGLARLFLPQG